VSTTVGAQRYLDLLKGVLTRVFTTEGPEEWLESARDGVGALPGAETMIGLRRLDNLDACIRTVLEDDVPGDLMECGVWRGGASIFMRAALEARGDAGRRVWVADSFQGIPQPELHVFPDDEPGRRLAGQMVASLDEVRANFARYGFLDDRVTFLPGFFRDTLPSAPVERLAVLRLDGDLYESTFVALESLYERVPPGGFVIIDDYNSFEPARIATDDFRRDHGISDPLESVDWTEVFWRKSG
jgi:hypothetical protein